MWALLIFGLASSTWVTTPGAVVAGHYESREACVTAALGVKDVTGKIELSSKTIAYCVKVEKP